MKAQEEVLALPLPPRGEGRGEGPERSHEAPAAGVSPPCSAAPPNSEATCLALPPHPVPLPARGEGTRRRALCFAAAAVTLAVAWLYLARLPSDWPFAVHMTMHMAVVALAAPLLALAIAGSRYDPVDRAPALFLAVPISLLELFAVWVWHAPALHHLARHTTTGLVTEQATFFVTGTWVWLAALGGDARSGGTRAGAGLVALLLTSMHMTLLGALLGLAPRDLYAHASPLADQHLGGAIMLLIGGASYLAGGLALAVAMLRRRAVPRVETS